MLFGTFFLENRFFSWESKQIRTYQFRALLIKTHRKKSALWSWQIPNFSLLWIYVNLQVEKRKSLSNQESFGLYFVLPIDQKRKFLEYHQEGFEKSLKEASFDERISCQIPSKLCQEISTKKVPKMNMTVIRVATYPETDCNQRALYSV